MTAPPEGLPGKLLALAICGLLLAAGYLVVIEPVLAFYQSHQQQLEERQSVIARLTDTARELPRLRAAAQQWREQSHDGDLLLTGPSDAVAAAGVQSVIKDDLAKGDAKLGSAEIIPPQIDDNFQRVGVRVSLSGTLPTLIAALRDLETARPMLFVDNVEIRTNSGAAKPDAGEELSIALDIYGFRAL